MSRATLRSRITPATCVAASSARRSCSYSVRARA
jgi:hypothetical protein